MKKLLLPFLLFALFSCGGNSLEEIEAEIEQSVTDFLKRRMKNPDSFKIEEIEIQRDTIPYYFNADVLSKADDTYEAFQSYLDYSKRGSYWKDEKLESVAEYINRSSQLEKALNKAKKEKSQVGYIVCLHSCGTNSYGGVVSSKYICIVDESDFSKILCLYDVDDDFYGKFYMIKLAESGGEFNLDKDRFGNYDTSNLSFAEKFIFGE